MSRYFEDHLVLKGKEGEKIITRDDKPCDGTPDSGREPINAREKECYENKIVNFIKQISALLSIIICHFNDEAMRLNRRQTSCPPPFYISQQDTDYIGYHQV